MSLRVENFGTWVKLLLKLGPQESVDVLLERTNDKPTRFLEEPAIPVRSVDFRGKNHGDYFSPEKNHGSGRKLRHLDLVFSSSSGFLWAMASHAQIATCVSPLAGPSR